MQIPNVGSTGLGLSALRQSNAALQKILERLSTAQRINRASDYAAGLSISEQLNTQINGFKMASQNVNDAMSALNIADGASSQIGDMLQRLTNHALPSTTHRVVNPAAERCGVARYSMPFFLHFAPDYLIQTLHSCVTADRPDQYPVPITANDYLEERLEEIKLK